MVVVWLFVGWGLWKRVGFIMIWVVGVKGVGIVCVGIWEICWVGRGVLGVWVI